MKKRHVILGIALVLLALGVGIGLTYSYFSAIIRGEGKKIIVEAGEVYVDFEDGDLIVSESSTSQNNAIIPGWSATKTFSVENQGNMFFYYNINIKDLINTFVSDRNIEYKITCTSGCTGTNGYSMTDYESIEKSDIQTIQTLAYYVGIEGLSTQEYEIEFRYFDDPDIDQSEDMGKKFEGALSITKGTKKTLYKTLTDGKKYSTVKTRSTTSTETINGTVVSTNFDNSLGGETLSDAYDTTGVIYKESTYKEEGLDVYYFAGNPQDNWVSFAGFNWRIIRTNEDGSVRLLYAGVRTDDAPYYGTDTQEGYIKDGTTTTFKYNNSYNNTMYVGWMYGSSGSIENNRENTNSSNAKTKVEKWYKENILDKGYDSLVSKDAIYCNDRASGAYVSSGSMYYAAYDRLYHNNTNGRQPSYQCGQNSGGGYTNTRNTWVDSTNLYTSSAADIADKFTSKTASVGNKQLEYPVGLITADEVAFAGGMYDIKSPNTYYYRNGKSSSECTGTSGDPCSITGDTYWWTMGPYQFSTSSAYVFNVRTSTFPGLSATNVNVAYGLRPVISLTSDALVSAGNGTAESPFLVKLP